MGKAFDVSEKYRNPVMVMVDGMLGQMMEPIVLPEMKEIESAIGSEQDKPWAITGHKNKRERNRIQSLLLQPEMLEKKVERFAEKYEKVKLELTEYETRDLEDAEIVFVAYGTTSRIAEEAREILAEEGIKAGLIRPITLWPFPYKAFEEISAKTKRILSVELSQGQMMDDVIIGANGRWPVSLAKRVGGMWLTPPEVAETAKSALRGV
jgi:2-oxoglutarate ferredoxin oxidoreductase subunit alpha